MDIVSYNPGHDGAVAHLNNGQLVVSVEAEKDSDYRYTPVGSRQLLDAFARVDRSPDVLCVGGWWPEETGSRRMPTRAGYRGIDRSDIIVGKGRLLGNPVDFFSSSHERSHLLCAYGMSPFPQGAPCYALVWEGQIGSFYEIDADVNITLIGDVLSEPGNRYASIYGLADPTFAKDSPFSRFSDAGKLMALASFSTRSTPTSDEEDLMEFLLSVDHVTLTDYAQLETSPYLDAGTDDAEFRNFAGILSDRIFETFHAFARRHLQKGLPLIISGGCGLNCDWNSKWVETGLFSDVFVPPVANDSGSAIGTAIDAQRHFTGNAKIDWDVYSGLRFEQNVPIPSTRYDMHDISPAEIAHMLSRGLILGWADGRYEIGPRALGNRSILAAPFEAATRIRLNDIKQREQFRPIAPVCLLDDAAEWFGCNGESPHMLYTYQTSTDALAAVTHVNGSARIQTVTHDTNAALHDVLVAFKKRTGYGVLCNTSLNFHGKGFINNLRDLDAYAVQHGLDGFVVDGRGYFLRESDAYSAFVGRETGPSQ